MKKISYSILCLIAVLVAACSEDDPQIGSEPTEADAVFTFAPSAANNNIINFTSATDAFLKKWDFGTGATATGNTATATFAVEGTYTVTLTVYTAGGSMSSTQQVVIAETDPTLLDIPVYNFLTGGAAALGGKTWVVDKEHSGHLGVGPSAGTWPEWYQAGPNEKLNRGLYDDKLTFKLDKFKFEYESEGTIYVNGAFSTTFPGAVQEPSGGDYIAPYTDPGGLTWTMTETAPGKWQLIINGGSHLGYYSGSNVYEVLALSENELYVRSIQGGTPANAWYQRFVPEGFTVPVDPPEYKIEDIEENFEAATILGFVNDAQASVVKYDNPAPVPINTSNKVGRYIKATGAGGQFGNIQVPLGYKMDIRTRHVFKLKVFIPSYNDYTAIGGEPWQSYNTLQKQVSIKLQNSELGGNAYTTQAEIIKNNLATDQWIELTFDFTAFAAREDFDKVIIQIGGEAIHAGGIFFFDDFELLP